jgi:hypothetical protein
VNPVLFAKREHTIIIEDTHTSTVLSDEWPDALLVRNENIFLNKDGSCAEKEQDNGEKLRVTKLERLRDGLACFTAVMWRYIDQYGRGRGVDR